MSKIEFFPIDFGSQRLTMHNDTTLFREVISTPNIMIANKEVNFYSHICQFGDFSQETGISFGDDQPETIGGANTAPLVLIDGIPGELGTVAPEDVESVDRKSTRLNSSHSS